MGTSRSTDLSESTAEPSSKISSTIPAEDGFFASLFAESLDLPLKNDLNLLMFFGGDGGGATELSGGVISTTMQVVSSFNPLVLNAS